MSDYPFRLALFLIWQPFLFQLAPRQPASDYPYRTMADYPSLSIPRPRWLSVPVQAAPPL